MPKKSRANRTGAAASYDTQLFATAKAAKRFEENFLHKAIISQRGFLLLNSSRNKEFTEPIQARQWEVFCHPPEATCVPVVREFFTNALDRFKSKIYVRGTWVTFTKQVINECYGLPTWGDDEDYLCFLSEIDMAIVSATICKPGTVWKMFGDVYKHFPPKGFT